MKKGNDRERERESQNQKFVYLLKKIRSSFTALLWFFIFGILAASAFWSFGSDTDIYVQWCFFTETMRFAMCAC